jgi:hypothetical protein
VLRGQKLSRAHCDVCAALEVRSHGALDSRRTRWARLVMLQNLYDPTNLFRVNQNIQPTA